MSLHIRDDTEKNVIIQVHIFIIDVPERINASVITEDTEGDEDFTGEGELKSFELSKREFMIAPVNAEDKLTAI
jgi:hypothetical protein